MKIDLAVGDDDDDGVVGPGAKGAKAIYSSSQQKRREETNGEWTMIRGNKEGQCNEAKRTLVYSRQVLEWRKQEHSDDAHAKDLYTPTGHVKHESLHGQRLDRRNSEIPSFPRLQIFVRVHRGGRRGLAASTTGCFSLIIDR